MEKGEYSPRLVIDERVWLIIEFITFLAGVEVKGSVSIINSDNVHPEDYTDEMSTGKMIRVRTDTGFRMARVVASGSDRNLLESIMGHFQDKESNDGQDLERTSRQVVPKIELNGRFATPNEHESDKEINPRLPEMTNQSQTCDWTHWKTTGKCVTEVQRCSEGTGLSRPTSGKSNKRLTEPKIMATMELGSFGTGTNDSITSTDNVVTFNQRTQTDSSSENLYVAVSKQKILQFNLAMLVKYVQSIKVYSKNLQTLGRKVDEVQHRYRQAVLAKDMASNDSGSQIAETKHSSAVKIEYYPGPASTIETRDSSESRHQTWTSEYSDSGESYVETSDFENMIPIGTGRTYVSEVLYNQIRWDNYSAATRKLLMGIFPRKVLATHSLTGKPSPAFANKLPKMRLDSVKISDIIMTVTQNSQVPENLVRAIITTKCSDEHKMYKIRMKNKFKPLNNTIDFLD